MTSQQGSENAIKDQKKVSVSPTSSPENIHVYTHTPLGIALLEATPIRTGERKEGRK
jgi:hypothetical protein